MPWFLACGSDAALAEPSIDGLPQPILRGHPAGADEQWGTVAVLVEQGNDAWDCTGTLIGARLVLTAAHCVEDDQTGQLADHVAVIAGADDVNMASPEQRYSCTHFAPHPQAFHNRASDDPAGIGAEHDLALLYTDRPVTQMSVVGILPASRLDSELTAGTRLTIAGFGDNALSRSGASFSAGDGMVQYVGELGFVRRGHYEFLAGGPDDSDTCQGDSGGPAYLKIDDTMWLVGTTARGRVDYRDVDCGMGGIYTLVPSYQDWIARTAQSLAAERASAPSEADAGVPEDDLDMSEDSPATPNDVGVSEVVHMRRTDGCTLLPFARRSTLWHALWLVPALLVRRRVRTTG